MVKNIWEKLKDPKHVFIIAEAGVNHNGDIGIAKQMIDLAKAANVDAIKFQSYKTDLLLSSKAAKTDYQLKTTPQSESAFEMLKKFELNYAQHKELVDYANNLGILFLSTPFDNESADMLHKFNMPLFKISSGDITNLPFLTYVSKKKKPMILSTGRSTLAEVKEAVNAMKRSGNVKIALLHCVSNYPAPFQDLNLKAIQTLKKTFKLPVGFSDHSLGIEASIAAVALGATIIEKHFTLDKTLPGPDHSSSLSPEELYNLVCAIRNIETAFGDGCKKPASSERIGTEYIRKGLTSAVNIPEGTKIKRDMVAIKRPALGISPRYLAEIIGTVALENIDKDTPITWKSIRRKR